MHYFQRWEYGKGGVFCKPESSAQVGGDVTYVATYAYTERTGCSEL
jgi:hypothetical protein